MESSSIIYQEDFTSQHRKIGKAASWAVFFLEMVYAVTTALGFLSLQSPDDPIGEPFFTMMELLIVLVAPLMVISLAAVHAYATRPDKVYSLLALLFMLLMAGITSCVHFVILTVGYQIGKAGLTWMPLFLSYQWPSVVYTLDILAWDWFFALSMLFAAPVFKGGRLEKIVRIFMILSGLLSMAGLIGVPLGNMLVRNIGIIGYGVAAPVVFLLLGIIFGRTQQVPTENS